MSAMPSSPPKRAAVARAALRRAVAGHDLVFDGVWKSYPRWAPGARTLRGVITRRVPALMRLREQRWALTDVSLRVGKGGSVGLIGQNGAGKSTLLRLASGLGRPTRGRIVVPDNTASVLSLGESFDGSLTGRENALTAALITGMRPRVARAALPAVLEFAELEAFADAPMRTYSEGMKLRLAFGVVAQLEPDVLLLDEVMAVGDLRFQAKCRGRIEEMRGGGTTVVLASHGLEQVAGECEQALWLQAGGVRSFGDAASVVAEYQGAMRSATMERTPAALEVGGEDEGGLELQRNRFGSQEVTVDSVALLDLDGEAVEEIPTGGMLTVALELKSRSGPLPDPIVSVAVRRRSDGVVCCDASSEAAGVSIGDARAGAQVRVTLGPLQLVPGDYVIDVGAYESRWQYAYDFHWQAYELRVTGRGDGEGVVRVPQRWEVEHS